MIWLVLFTIVQVHQDKDNPVKELIERLRSEDFRLREEAGQKLKALGRLAQGPLETATRDADPEVAASARRVLQVIRVREQLGARVVDAIPDADERIASDEAGGWAHVFLLATSLDATGRVIHPSLNAQDLSLLATGALRGTPSDDILPQLLSRIEALYLPELAPLVASLLSHREPSVKTAALRTLLALRARSHLPVILERLQDANPDVRDSALRAVSSLGTRTTLVDITPLLASTSVEIRRIAIRAIGALGRESDCEDLVPLLKDSNRGIRQDSIRALGLLGSSKGLPHALALLKDESSAVRVAALRALPELGIQDKEALSILTGLLKDQDQFLRLLALQQIEHLGLVDAARAVKSLLGDPQASIAAYAIVVLAHLAPEEAATAISSALTHQDSQVRESALRALIVTRKTDLLLEVAALRKDASDNVRATAAEALILLGLDSSPRPSIQWALEDKSETVKYRAVQALGKTRRTDVLELVKPFLSSTAPDVRGAAILAAAPRLEPAERPMITGFLSDPNSEVRHCAMEACIELGLTANEKQFSMLLQDPYVRVRSTVLWSWTPRSPNVVPALKAALSDRSLDVRILAAEKLCERGERDGIAILMEEGLPRTALNGLRSPKIWNCWIESPVGEDLKGTRQDVLKTIASRYGCRLLGLEDLPPHCSRWLQRRIHMKAEDKFTPGKCLQVVVDSYRSPVCAVLEEGRLRILDSSEGMTFWTTWLKSRADSK